MSVHGYTPVPSETSVQSAASATSSSHQPATKQLKAFEENEDAQITPKQLLESTDEEPGESEQKKECGPVPAFPEEAREAAEAFTASPVPNVPEDADEAFEEAEEGRHDADDFVPNRQREQTLEGNTFQLNVKAEVYEIEEDTKDEENKQSDDEREMHLHSLTQPPKATPEERCSEGSSATPAFETVGPQPSASSTNLLEFSPCASSAVSDNSKDSRSEVPDF